MQDPYADFASQDPYADFSSKAPRERAKPRPKSNTGVGLVDRANDERLTNYDTMKANQRAAKAAPRMGFADSVAHDFNEPRLNALAGMKEGYDQFSGVPLGGSFMDQTRQGIARGKASGKVLMNDFALLASPITGTLDVIGRPIARAAESLGIGDEQSNRNAMATASMALAPETNALGLPSRAATVAKIAPKATAPAKAVENLTAQKNAAYQAVDAMGVKYAPKAMGDLAANMRAGMEADHLNPMIHPKATAMLKQVEALKDTSPTLTEVDQLRQAISRDVAGSADKGERFMGKKMIQEIDDFLAAPKPEHIIAGDGEAASKAILHARDMNTRLRKVETVGRAVDKGELRAASTGSGGNANNAMRQNLRRVLETQRNLLPEERSALEDIVRGSKTQNVMRQVGKLSPQGNGLMLGAQLAALAPSGGMSGFAALGGAVAKAGADTMTANKIGKLVTLMAAGGERGLAAEASLAALASKNAQAKRVYNAVAARLTQGAALTTEASGVQRQLEAR